MQKDPLIRIGLLVLLITLIVSGVVNAHVQLSHAAEKHHPVKRSVSTSPIQKIVLIEKENHSFDNYFGAFPGVNGATTGKVKTSSGVITIPLNALTDTPTNFTHLWGAAHTDYDNGKMDAFNKGTSKCGTAPYPCYAVASQSLIPNYWQLAQHFVLADNAYSSLMGPSFPNHLFTVAGASGPDSAHSAINNPVYPSGSIFKSWGCDAPTGTKVSLLNGSTMAPCFSPTGVALSTFADELSANGVSWKSYAPSSSENGYVWNTLDAFAQDRTLPNVVNWSAFDADASSGALPSFSWLVAPFDTSEHPPASICAGENWTIDKINAIENGPDAASTLIVVTFDDFGGFYEHVAPQQVDQLGYGFRVPFLIISPYAYASDNTSNPHVYHDQLELSSVIKYAEQTFNAPSMGRRDASAGDMSKALDFSQVHNTPLVLSQRTCGAAPKTNPGMIGMDGD